MSADDPVRTAVQRYCTFISQDRLLVQAAGGNISWKSGDTLWIKASGTWLADAENKEIFVPVDRRPLNDALLKSDYSVKPKNLHGQALRPSIETLLHALMPHKYVVHLHPVDAVVYLSRGDCRADLQATIGNSLAWALVEYQKPGAELAQAVHSSLREKQGINAVLLKNHGVILGAESLEEIDNQLVILCNQLGTPPRSLSDPANGLSETVLNGVPYRICSAAALQCFVSDPELYERLEDSWAICPDHVVFLGPRAIRLDDPMTLRNELIMADPVPPYVFVKGKGVLEHHAVTLAQKAQITFYLDVMLRQPIGQRLVPLSYKEIMSLIDWDAEKYRLTLNQ
jgi:rhamnose utilization protein RhaD (predicted bifunctional aldolase and dehydrogenase)